MLREQTKIVTTIHKLLDLFLTACAFIFAYSTKKYLLPEPFKGLTTGPNYYIVLLMVLVTWYIVFDIFGLYEPYRRREFWKIFTEMAKALFVAMLIFVGILFIVKLKDISRLMLGIFLIYNVSFLTVFKACVYFQLKRFRRQDYNIRYVLIVGSRSRAIDLIHVLDENIGTGYRVVGCLDIDKDCTVHMIGKDCQMIGTVDQLPEILNDQIVDELIFAMPLKIIPEADKYIAIAMEMGVSVRIIPDWQLHYLMETPSPAAIRFEEFLGIHTMALEMTPPQKGGLLLKAAVDYMAAGFSLLLLAPFMVLIAVLIKLLSPGPALFKQQRSGVNGRQFTLYKFRTMVVDAEQQREKLEQLNEMDGPVFKLADDPRIIPHIGKFLRKTSLDELPQLINVLKGEMSLIGPRPPLPDEVSCYERWQMRRLSMRPGLTCLWQISPKRNDVSFEEWMNMDLKYIDNWSIGLDVRIFFSTIWVMLVGYGK